MLQIIKTRIECPVNSAILLSSLTEHGGQSVSSVLPPIAHIRRRNPAQ